jgi:hypothetical protein
LARGVGARGERVILIPECLKKAKRRFLKAGFCFDSTGFSRMEIIRKEWFQNEFEQL